MLTARARQGGVAAEYQGKVENDLTGSAPDEPQPKAASGALDLASLFHDYLGAVHHYVSQRVDNPADAEDVTAEVFVAAAAQVSGYRAEGGHFAWLTGIARRKMVDRDRRRQRRPELLAADLTAAEREGIGLLLATDIGDLPEEAVQHEEARLMMRKLITQLPPAQREALLLQVVDDLPIKQIAKLIGRTPAAVNSLLERARAALLRNGRGYFEG